MLSQGRDLRPRVASGGQVKSHLLHQHVGRRCQHHPKRIGREVRATGPADVHAVVQFFYPILDVAPLTVSLLDPYLPRAVENGRDLEARAYMFAAASMGATAFQKGLGAIHSISHPVGARYDTHHGLTNGVVFPYVLACNRTAIADKIPHIARALDLPGRNFD